jgi:cyanophycin synthetase
MKSSSKRSAVFSSFSIIGEPREFSGYIHGLRYPCLMVLLQITIRSTEPWLTLLTRSFAGLLERDSDEKVPPEPESARPPMEEAVISMLYWMGRFYESAGFPVFENGKIIGTEEDASAVMVLLPTLPSMHKVTEISLLQFLEIFNIASSGAGIQDALNQLALMRQSLGREASVYSANVLCLLWTSFQHGIPFFQIENQAFQFGYGSWSRILESTFTDQTSVIGTHLARIKPLGAALMNRAGIPVPEQRRVATIEEALIAAVQLGYPVVVKPAGNDVGTALAAALMTMDEVRSAFTAARQKSAHIFVEKHFEGHDYRITVFQGKPVRIVEKVPGNVTGAGRSTVNELADRLNPDRGRNTSHHSSLKKPFVDEEADPLQAKKGLDFADISAEGNYVQRQKASDNDCGAALLPDLFHIHPDNLSLAVRIATLFRLDLAEISLRISDISRSWMETAAAVFDVNAQPGLGGFESIDVYDQILTTLVRGNGRIPVALVVGVPLDWQLAGDIVSGLAGQGIAAGYADRSGVRKGNTMLHDTAATYEAGTFLVMDRSIDAMILCVNDISLLSTGLPFERFDLLVLAGPDITGPPDMDNTGIDLQLQALFDFIAPCCDGEVIMVSGTGAELLEPFLFLPGNLKKRVVAKKDACLAVMEAMICQNKNYQDDIS